MENNNVKLKPKYGTIKNVVGILSGKGGVGKSTVTAMTAVALKKLGYKVGVLDADITGPSIPRFFGVPDAKTGYLPTENENEFQLIPVESRLGIPLQSMNFMVEEETPVMWRGPILSNVLTQMFQDTQWGDLDYLLIDMPPGTGDVAITVMSQFPTDYFIIVSSPQDMVTMIVNKIVNMTKQLDVPIKGVIENMAYFICDNCEKKHYIFSKNSSEVQAQEMGLKLLAELPIDPKLTENLERGIAEQYVWDTIDATGLMESFKEDEENLKKIKKDRKLKTIPFIMKK